MPLSAGDKLGHYEILALLGQGGMGEVYRARDTTLQRDVALKVLPATFLRDPERMARFQREAQVLASLDHPNIGHIHGIVDSADSRGLVLALIEGPTLADRIAAGPLPQAEAIAIAQQIIEALEYAHDRGVVHRDLKPANVKITPEGVVKVLDFGLAKVLEDEPPASSLTDSPTLTVGHTRAGMILGTAAYMSPEQAVGRPVDRRSDIFSFGAVLYEILTGKHAFAGETTPDVLEAVVKNDPDWSALPEGTPEYLRRLLERVLTKDRKQRLQAIGEARIALEDLASGVESPTPARSLPSKLGWVVAAMFVVAFAGLGFVHFREAPPEQRLIETTILPPENATFDFIARNSAPAISPDGRRIIFSGQAGGKSQLWIRPLDSPVAQPLVGTENARYPFWSPDNRSVAFFAGGKLKRIDVLGGPVQTIADEPNPGGGSWSPSGVIVYSVRNGTELRRVAASGGTPTPATEAAGYGGHQFPWFLSDGRHFLFTAYEQRGSGRISIGSLDAKEVKTLGPASSNVMYAQGHLLFLRDSTLMAQPFDEQRLATTGDATPIGERVQVLDTGFGCDVGAFTVSRDGLLAYQTGDATGAQQLTWFDRSGKPTGTLGEVGDFEAVELSPDRRSLAVALHEGRNIDLWIYEVARELRTRFTFSSGNIYPVWSPDGRSIIFSSNSKGRFDFYRKSANLTGAEEMLYADAVDKYSYSVSADGKFLLYQTRQRRDSVGDNFDLWMLPLTPGTSGVKPSVFLQTTFAERQARFSPDDKWVAYVSNESERNEVYVVPFPGSGAKKRISINGGQFPRWRADGKELFYAANRSLMAVEVASKGGSMEVGAARSLGIPVIIGRQYMYDVSQDGQRFLVAAAPEQKSSTPLTLVQNWTALLKK